MKITVVIFGLLTLAMGTGAAMHSAAGDHEQNSFLL
jgi:hypothetical protein